MKLLFGPEKIYNFLMGGSLHPSKINRFRKIPPNHKLKLEGKLNPSALEALLKY